MSSEIWEIRQWIPMEFDFTDDYFENLETRWLDVDLDFEEIINEIILDRVGKRLEKIGRLFNLKLDSKYFADVRFLERLYEQLDSDIQRDKMIIANRKRI